MLSRLAVETQIRHASIDAALLAPLVSPTRSSYRRYLCTLYGFIAPLEVALAMAPGIDYAFIDPRMKSGRIASDLLALGLTTQEFALLSRRHSVPAFTSAAEALGWMYVMERTTLHHEETYERLRRILSIDRELAANYLLSYAGETRARWRELGAVLDRVAWSASAVDTMIGAAWDAFESLDTWLGAQPMVRSTAHVSPLPLS
jgi:heme oxygenase